MKQWLKPAYHIIVCIFLLGEAINKFMTLHPYYCGLFLIGAIASWNNWKKELWNV